MLNIARRAQSLKVHRPPRGLNFSLQQQSKFIKIIIPLSYLYLILNSAADSVQISYSLMAALLANAFFSTFPKRTQKTHPTLQDFNFTNFFKHLDQLVVNAIYIYLMYVFIEHSFAFLRPIQQAKLQSLITYFDWIETPENINGAVTISRQVIKAFKNSKIY